MSRILDILAAIAGLAPAVDGVTPAVWEPDDLHVSAESADLPVRVISPFDEAGGAMVAFTSAAGNRTAEWTISDILLWRETGMGRGPADVGLTLPQYIAAYLEELDTLRHPQYRVINATMRAGAVIWPAGTDRQYDGVRVTLTIRELLGG